jgi:oxygen-independent coproporphyrinogen-3 oxidase
MSGIYIHIPFCRKICYYCDFYKTPKLNLKDKFLSSFSSELSVKENFLNDKKISTIYFGGGTPSLLNSEEINFIIEKISEKYDIDSDAEITLEANPDDLTEEYLINLKNTKINRLSIGIQSFQDKDLTLMNRRHNSENAINCIKLSQKHGFTNISVDLIYGLPEMTAEIWKKNLEIFFNLKIPHLSAYHLTYEENTVFYKYRKSGKIKEVAEENSIKFYEILIEEAQKNNFIQYEISNFAKESYFSKHNSSYWLQKEYLGLGPSAHSYNGAKREWNISDLKLYIEKIEKSEQFWETELLDSKSKYNDYIITSLRTLWGTDLNFIKKEFGEKYYNFCVSNSKEHLERSFLKLIDNKLILTDSAKFISDSIIEDLFYL